MAFTVKVANMEIVYEDHKIYGENPSQRVPKFCPEGGSQLSYIYFIKYIHDYYCDGTLMWGS